MVSNISDVKAVIYEKARKIFFSRIKKVLFVIPPEIPPENFRVGAARNKRYACFPPYGPGLLARHLARRGYSSDILDLNFCLLQDAHSNFEFSYDAWRDRLQDKIKNFSPDLVGISCMFTMGHSQMSAIAEFVKTNCGDVPVMAGGVHPTNAAEGVLKDCKNIDFLNLFEGEISFPDFLDAVNGLKSSKEIKQIACLVNGEFLRVDERALPKGDDLNSMPEYFDLPIDQYDKLGQIGAYTFMREEGAFTILAEKGCRARCDFCSVEFFNGPGVRDRSVESVADEIAYMKETYGTSHFMLLDDDALYPEKRALKLFNEIVRRNLKVTWDATNGIIAAAITDEIMHAASESGCIGLALGIESGNADILRAVHKPGTPDSFRKAKKILEKFPHIFVRGFLIIGFLELGETYKQLLDTVNLGLELNFDWYPVQILNPLPSTKVYKTMLEQGLLEDGMQIGTNVVIGPAGKQRLREEREKVSAEDFLNLFNVHSLEERIAKENLEDLWFIIDYKLNYEKILNWNNIQKLRLQQKMMRHVCDRLTVDVGNPLANLFLAICEQKLNEPEEFEKRIGLTEKYIAESEYWQKRFDALQLYELLEKTKNNEFYIPR